MEVASLKREETTLTVHEEDGYVSEDEQIQNLEQTGQMQQVIGSQSILSQELHNLDFSQSQPSRAGGGDGFSQDMGGFSQVSVHSTATADFDSQQLAHQYGLLSQDPFARVSRTELDSQQGTNFESSQESKSSRASSHRGFGTLLDAVSIFQSQEEEEERKLARKRALEEEANSENGGVESLDEAGAISDRKEQKTRAATRSSSRTKTKSKRSPSPISSVSKKNSKPPVSKKPSLPLSKNNSSLPLSKNNSSNAVITNSTGSSSSTNCANNANRKRKRKDESEQIIQQNLAKRAADLAQRTINDPELAKRLLLSMALTRENPRSAPETLPGPGHVLPEGFFWAHYPPLEKVLKDNMVEYYELSITKCQSAQQQSFNNELVELVRAESNRQGWLYAPCFTDKCLRDRIRCYYKTHIQNAKKRLRTMVKNPTKRANARHLCNHLDMIEANVEKNAQSPCIDPDTTAVITHQDWGSAFAGNIKDAAQAIVSAQDKAASFEARVAASVAVATKTINDEVAMKKSKRTTWMMMDIAPRPDDSISDTMPRLSGSVPVLTAAMLTVPSATPAPTQVAFASPTAPTASAENTKMITAATEPIDGVSGTTREDPVAPEAVAIAEAARAITMKTDPTKPLTDTKVGVEGTPSATVANSEVESPAPTTEKTAPALVSATTSENASPANVITVEADARSPSEAYADPSLFHSPAKSTTSEGEVLFV